MNDVIEEELPEHEDCTVNFTSSFFSSEPKHDNKEVILKPGLLDTKAHKEDDLAYFLPRPTNQNLTQQKHQALKSHPKPSEPPQTSQFPTYHSKFLSYTPPPLTLHPAITKSPSQTHPSFLRSRSQAQATPHSYVYSRLSSLSPYKIRRRSRVQCPSRSPSIRDVHQDCQESGKSLKSSQIDIKEKKLDAKSNEIEDLKQQLRHLHTNAEEDQETIRDLQYENSILREQLHAMKITMETRIQEVEEQKYREMADLEYQLKIVTEDLEKTKMQGFSENDPNHSIEYLSHSHDEHPDAMLDSPSSPSPYHNNDSIKEDSPGPRFGPFSEGRIKVNSLKELSNEKRHKIYKQARLDLREQVTKEITAEVVRKTREQCALEMREALHNDYEQQHRTLNAKFKLKCEQMCAHLEAELKADVDRQVSERVAKLIKTSQKKQKLDLKNKIAELDQEKSDLGREKARVRLIEKKNSEKLKEMTKYVKLKEMELQRKINEYTESLNCLKAKASQTHTKPSRVVQGDHGYSDIRHEVGLSSYASPKDPGHKYKGSMECRLPNESPELNPQVQNDETSPAPKRSLIPYKSTESPQKENHKPRVNFMRNSSLRDAYNECREASEEESCESHDMDRVYSTNESSRPWPMNIIVQHHD